MNIGRLRHRVTLQRFGSAPDGAGGYEETWATFATVYAAVEPLRGREFMEAQQTENEVTTRIRIRPKDGIRPDMRVRYKDKTYRIETIINIEERNREMQLMCVEVAGDG